MKENVEVKSLIEDMLEKNRITHSFPRLKKIYLSIKYREFMCNEMFKTLL